MWRGPAGMNRPGERAAAVPIPAGSTRGSARRSPRAPRPCPSAATGPARRARSKPWSRISDAPCRRRTGSRPGPRCAWRARAPAVGCGRPFGHDPRALQGAEHRRGAGGPAREVALGRPPPCRGDGRGEGWWSESERGYPPAGCRSRGMRAFEPGEGASRPCRTVSPGGEGSGWPRAEGTPGRVGWPVRWPWSPARPRASARRSPGASPTRAPRSSAPTWPTSRPRRASSRRRSTSPSPRASRPRWRPCSRATAASIASSTPPASAGTSRSWTPRSPPSTASWPSTCAAPSWSASAWPAPCATRAGGRS